jgi:hypothetical protein
MKARNIATDLAYFDNYCGIPDLPSFQEVYANGTPQGNSNWGLEKCQHGIRCASGGHRFAPDGRFAIHPTLG